MRIILADSDRDFIDAYSRLLTLAGHEVTTVFDGTQLLGIIGSEKTDLIILNQTLPRVSVIELIQICNRMKIPTIVLSEGSVTSDMLCGSTIGTAYLPFPFLPHELLELTETIIRQRRSNQILQYKDVAIKESDFILCDTIRVTSGEIAVFRALMNHEPMNNKKVGPYITALNHKLMLLHNNLRIKYMINDGYRMVSINNE